jgi:hypothetical protein
VKLSSKLNILNDLGIVDWLNEGKDDDNLRIIVNSIAEYFFEGKSIYDYAPASDWDAIHEHFTQTGYDIDWYEMITFNFSERVKEECCDAVHCINYHEFIMPKEELELCIIDWVENWCFLCNKVFAEAMKPQHVSKE